jgi:hypothetical protein
VKQPGPWINSSILRARNPSRCAGSGGNPKRRAVFEPAPGCFRSLNPNSEIWSRPRPRRRARPRCIGFRDRQETGVLPLICSVNLIAKRSGFSRTRTTTSTRTTPQIRNSGSKDSRSATPNLRLDDLEVRLNPEASPLWLKNRPGMSYETVPLEGFG